MVKSNTRLGVIGKRILLSVFFSLTFLVSAALMPIDVYAVASTLTISITNNISLNISSTDMTGSFAHSDTNTPNVSVRTTNGSGYTLGIKASTSGANNNALVNTTDNTKTIPSITTSGGISESTYSSDSSYNNTWGYRPSKLNSSANSNYLPAPNSNTTQVVLDQTTTSNPTTDNTYNIALGVRIDRTTTPGSYANTFIFTATANPTPYTITYNKNTSDTVTNMPSNESSATYSETVTLSNQVPARDGYDFKGWCTVQVADDATCTGTTYNPDGGGTNLNWTIDQTQPSASLTIYAVWATSSAVSCNPNGTTIGTNTNTDIKCLQDFASLSSSVKTALKNSMTTGSQYTLADKRDGKTYTIAKLADGKVWMTQNLDLDLNSNTTYTNQDTDLGWNTSTSSYQTASWTPSRSTYATATNNIHAWCAGGTWNSQAGQCDNNNTPESYDPGDLYWNEATSGWLDWGSYSDSCSHTTSTPSCNESLNPISTYTSHTGDPTTQLHLGNYYNWPAAIASNNASTYGANNTLTNQSICPVGWTLPYSYYNPSTGQNLGDFADLWTEYGWPNFSVSTLWASPLYFVGGGNYTGYIYGVGLRGSYWASVAVDASRAQDGFFYTDSGADPAEYDNRSNGNLIRCVLRST